MADRRLFDKLRTEKQLGYIVHSGMTMRGGVAEFNVMVESPNTKPHELWTILQEELKDLPDFIGKMADAEMTQWLNGVRDTIDQDDLNTIQEGNRLLDELTESGACLDMRENELHYLEKHPPTQDNLRQAFKDILTGGHRVVVLLGGVESNALQQDGVSQTVRWNTEDVKKLQK
eukprot:GHVN01019339.1.p4 GENE.GHVN01019339.1~~GHVN01019339.1.p4  ORF type:complete len:174 (+),score=34.19 GHVN01019339.1:2749-3270(+)